MWFPPPPPRGGIGRSWAGLIFGTLATLVFTGSLLLNAVWIISSAMHGDDGPKEHVITPGDLSQKVAVVPVDGIIMGREAEQFDKLMKKGVGLVFLHYSDNIRHPVGRKYMLDWLGGYHESNYSRTLVQGGWEMGLASPQHPISRGVKRTSSSRH